MFMKKINKKFNSSRPKIKNDFKNLILFTIYFTIFKKKIY